MTDNEINSAETAIEIKLAEMAEHLCKELVLSAGYKYASKLRSPEVLLSCAKYYLQEYKEQN